MTSRSTRLAAAGLLAAGSLSLVAACGDDDAPDAKTTAACKSDLALTDGFTKLVDQTPALQGNGPPPKSAIPAIRANYDKFVAGPLAEFEKNVPEDIAGEVKYGAPGIKKIRNGDFSAVTDPKFEARTASIDPYFYDNCDEETTEVKGPDYGFEGLDDSYPAGVRRFKLQNTGKEAHQMVILRRKPGVTENFDQILKLDNSDSKITAVAAADPVDPGKASYTSANLTKGEYIAICFLPKGTTSVMKEGKGPPHFTLGMKKEFKVE